jgi:hypothetical protein
VEQSFEVKKLEMVKIWEGMRGVSVRSEEGIRGLRGGQFSRAVDGGVDFGGLVEECFLGGMVIEATFQI